MLLNDLLTRLKTKAMDESNYYLLDHQLGFVEQEASRALGLDQEEVN